MGGTFNFKGLKATTDQEAVAEGKSLIVQARNDHGRAGYTGSFAECDGVEMAIANVSTVAEARDWLEENTEKWGAMLIVKMDARYFAGAMCSY